MKTISIGRDDQCNIVLIDKTSVVSRRHAVITIDNWGKMTITDYSANGTYINGIKMSSNVPVPITRKDTISFAHVADLDWRLVPNVRRKLLSTTSIAGSVIVIAGIILGLVLLKPAPEEPTTIINPEPQETIVNPDNKPKEDYTYNENKKDESKDKENKKDESKDNGGKKKKDVKNDKKENKKDNKQDEELPSIDPIIL